MFLRSGNRIDGFMRISTAIAIPLLFVCATTAIASGKPPPPPAAVPTNTFVGYAAVPVPAPALPETVSDKLTVPTITCPAGPTNSINAGDVLWDIGGQDVEAFVKLTCNPVPSYLAETAYYAPPGPPIVTGLFPVVPGNRIMATLTTKGAASTATVDDLTTHAKATTPYGPVGSGAGLFGMFCPTAWMPPAPPAPLMGTPPCTTLPSVTTPVLFGGATINGKYVATFAPTPYQLTVPPPVLFPGAIGRIGRAFNIY